MSSIDSLIQALDERTIAQRVGRKHDDARLRYRLDSSTVPSWKEFEDQIGDYYSYHYGQCVSVGGHLDPGDARSRAKELLEREYRRKRGDIASAYADSRDGVGGGLREVLDSLCEGLKAEAVQRHVRDLFDQAVEPVDFQAKVRIIAGLFARLGPHLAGSVQLDRPERYARDYQTVIEAYVEGLRQTSSVFRRL